jgi:predicted RNA binding protein YcfA (HicA-like mRNA interferase family)
MPITRKKLIRQFRKIGFCGPLTGGRHQFMAKGNLKIRIPNPHGNDISESLLKEILRQAGIPREDFDQ